MKNLKLEKIFVAGGTGFLGKRVIKKLNKEKINFCQTSLSQGVDFREIKEINKFIQKEKPTLLINCAAYVGGIKFGLEHPGEIYYHNTLMASNLMESARLFAIKRFINPISNCSYPNVGERQFREEDWWAGSLDESVMAYGMCRKMSWVQAWAYHKQYQMDFINLILPNMYGPGDHFEEIRSHAMGALIMKIANAKEKNEPQVIIWGTGKPVREWLYVDDATEVIYKSLTIEPFVEAINIGSGKGITIKEMADIIKKIVGYQGELIYDETKPDGAPFKEMNADKCQKIFNWRPPTALADGIKNTITDYYENFINKKE